MLKQTASSPAAASASANTQTHPSDEISTTMDGIYGLHVRVTWQPRHDMRRCKLRSNHNLRRCNGVTWKTEDRMYSVMLS